MRDAKADFNSFKTFGWVAMSADLSGQPLSILDSNIRAAIATELKGKGYGEAAAGTIPDLRIDYETARAEKIKSSPFRIGIDSARNAEVWTGSVSRELGKCNVEPAQRLLARLPAMARASRSRPIP